jgi:hypothetical protein
MDSAFQPWQPSGAARLFGPIIQPQTYYNLAYLLLAFPVGTAYFILIVTGLSLGAGLAITLIGVPVLLATLVAVRACAAFERSLTNALLGASVPPIPIMPAAVSGILPRVKALITSRRTWKDLCYLLLEFPIGILTFTFALVLITVPPYLLFLPIYYRWTDFYYAPYHRVNSLADALFFVPIGALLIPIALHAINGMAALYRTFARALLGGE